MGWCKTEAISSYKIIQLWNAGQKKEKLWNAGRKKEVLLDVHIREYSGINISITPLCS